MDRPNHLETANHVKSANHPKTGSPDPVVIDVLAATARPAGGATPVNP